MLTIYLDVLIAINFYIAYLLIRSTCVFLHQNVSAKRVLLGSAFGALPALLIFLPDLGAVLSIAIKIAAGILLCLIVFGFKNRNDFMKRLIVFLVINFIFAGTVMFINDRLSPEKMYVNNGAVYYDVSLIVLIGGTAAAYGAMRLLRYILDGKSTDKAYRARLVTSTGSAETDALADSGNRLYDAFSGLPVVVFGLSAVEGAVPQGVVDYLTDGSFDESGIRLIPIKTVAGSGLLPAFKPLSLEISCGAEKKSVSAMVAVSKDEASFGNQKCIFNPKILI